MSVKPIQQWAYKGATAVYTSGYFSTHVKPRTSRINDGKQAANQLITIIAYKKQMRVEQSSDTGWVTLIKMTKQSLPWTAQPFLLTPCQSTQLIRLPREDKQHLFKSSSYQSIKRFSIRFTIFNNCYYMVHVFSTNQLEIHSYYIRIYLYFNNKHQIQIYPVSLSGAVIQQSN